MFVADTFNSRIVELPALVVSPATSTVSASPSSIAANGVSSSTITVQAKDANGSDETSGGATVTMSTTAGSLSGVTDNGDGTYTASLTSTHAGTADVSATINGQSITSGDAIVTFVAPPVVKAVSPSSGPVTGGTQITITGTGFVAGASVAIGGQGHPGANAIAATNVVVVSATEITATTGPGTGQVTPNTYNVFVTDTGGTSAVSKGDAFTYTRVLSHFVVSSIATQAAGQSFTVKVTAEDATNQVVTSYAGSPAWSDATGSLSPSVPAAFVKGVATSDRGAGRRRRQRGPDHDQ